MTLRVWVAVFALANVVLFAYGLWVERGAAAGQTARPAELERERIKLVPPKEAIEQGIGQKPRACVEWGGFSAADVARAERAVAPLKETASIETRRADTGTSSYWVYLAPQPSRRAADRVADELRRSGQTDFYVVQDDSRFANAISLGLFSTEAAANNRRAQVAKLGLGDINIQVRDGTAVRYFVRMREVPSTVSRRLDALRADFPATAVRDCP